MVSPTQASTHSPNTQVRVEQGVLEGNQKNGVFRFRGIPYAASPVANLRWAAPRPPAAWDGVRDARNFDNAAIQTVDNGADLGAPQSEDCLYLNVWTPSLEPQARQPVMVWIHGGGFLNWSGSMPEYHGASLARRGVTYVSFNYRLGAFGFLHHPETGGNAAVQDWVAALKWVSRNITAFGGDPPAALPDPARERVTEASSRLFEQLGSSDIEHLRRAPVEQVRQASRLLAGTMPKAGEIHTPANLVWCPAEDGQVVGPDLSCWAPDVPVLFGHTSDEARFFLTPRGPLGLQPDTVDPAEIYTPATLAQMATVLGGRQAEHILARLRGSPYEALAELVTAAIWAEPALASYRRFAELGYTAYSYRFARVSPGNRRTGMLAFHCSELSYVFGHLTSSDDYDEVDASVSDTLMHAWTTFARTGVPTNPDGVAWPAATSTAPLHTVIDDKAHSCPLDTDLIGDLINSLRADS